VKSIETSLSRLEGVKSAKVGAKKSLYVVKVLENKSLAPAKIKEALEGGNYSFEGAAIELVGTVAKDGDNYTLTARASETKYALKANEDLKKLVADGKTTLLVKGELTEPEEKDKDGKKLPCVIDVAEAKEPPKSEK
jgi:copper chaperone CopZ